ncbi:MAG: hypothetical protein C0476_04145, partial [Sphingomonas sp.]|nr:hypothetical protein [Sphingomonas sp.]
ALQRLSWSIAIFAPIGGMTGYYVGRTLKAAGPGGVPFTWTLAELFSLVIALMLIISGVVVAIAATSDRRWNRMVEDQAADEPVDPAARTSGVRQAWVCILAGGLMLAPPIAAHIPLGVEVRVGLAVVIGLLMVVETWINLKLWRDGDELTRAVIAQTGALCFWTLQLGLFGWAALAKLDLVPDIDGWTMFTLVMGTYLIVSVVIARRRGLVPDR